MQAPTHFFFFHAGPFKSDTSSQLSRVWASGRSSLGDGLLVLTIKTLKRKQCFDTFYYLYLESHPLKIVERRDRYRSAELPLVLFNQNASLAISSRSKGGRASRLEISDLRLESKRGSFLGPSPDPRLLPLRRSLTKTQTEEKKLFRPFVSHHTRPDFTDPYEL